MLKNKLKEGRVFLAGISFLLAGLAMAIAFPDGLNEVNKQPNFIGVVELAEKIKNRESFTLIDLRDSASFESFHIPGAQNLTFQNFDPGLLNGVTIYYSGDDLRARRLWDSLENEERAKTFILYGGIHDWYDRLQYPTLPFGDHITQPELLKRVHDLCQFYGGYAEFEPDSTLLNYYQINLSSAKWPKASREGVLVRKGC